MVVADVVAVVAIVAVADVVAVVTAAAGVTVHLGTQSPVIQAACQELAALHSSGCLCILATEIDLHYLQNTLLVPGLLRTPYIRASRQLTLSFIW